MAFYAKYLEAPISVDALRGALASVAGRLSPGADAPDGWVGMDHYMSFYHKGILGQAMVKEANGYLSVVIFTMPSMLQRGKARALVEAMAAAVPGGEIGPYPGKSGGILKFI